MRLVDSGVAALPLMAFVEETGRLQQQHLRVEVEILEDLHRTQVELVRALELIHLEMEAPPPPGDELENGLLDLLSENLVELVALESSPVEQHPTQRDLSLSCLSCRASTRDFGVDQTPSGPADRPTWADQTAA